MIIDTPTLRSLDEELEERAELLSEAARKLPKVGPAEREHLRTRALGFLRDELGAHTLSNQHVLYPKIAERLGDPFAAAPMNYADRAIRWWTDEIARADIDDTDELQRLLYGVHALIKVHLSREEDLYVGALESAAWPAEGD
ncbi:MAG TPA: hemerythrin domain-containing protein [Gaiellaceae bacterium]|nr:hemerythrin domain-containing protein [Gaiellaceae bacterium]